MCTSTSTSLELSSCLADNEPIRLAWFNNVSLSSFIEDTRACFLARRALWGVLQTQMKMKEYIRIGIKNHPSISSEYVRFLIQKASLGRVARLEKENQALREQLKEVESVAREAKRKGETALNRADEAKKLAAKK